MSAPSKTTAYQNNPPLVFVVDDNFALTKMAELIITSAGYQCHSFCDPAQVLAALDRKMAKPDLLLTDYEMGSMNGLQLIARCREEIPDIKTILVSGTVQPETLQRESVKIDQFLQKPYQPSELAKSIKALIPK